MEITEFEKLVCSEIKVRSNSKGAVRYKEMGYTAKDGFYNVKVKDIPKSSRLQVSYKGKTYTFKDLMKLEVTSSDAIVQKLKDKVKKLELELDRADAKDLEFRKREAEMVDIRFDLINSRTRCAELSTLTDELTKRCNAYEEEMYIWRCGYKANAEALKTAGLTVPTESSDYAESFAELKGSPKKSDADNCWEEEYA